MTLKQVMVARRGTLGLVIVLAAVFILETALGAAGSERALVPLGALRTRGWSAADWWRILTFSFLHLTWLHLATSAVGLLWLGGIVERRLGSAAFAAIVAAGAAASGTAGMLLGPFLQTTGIAIGASGGVFGLLAAALMLAFRRQPAQAPEGDRRIRRPLLICLIAVTAISFVPGVSLSGHLGSFVGGALMASMFM
jgi:membrane associated rhomboid family serine protease